MPRALTLAFLFFTAPSLTGSDSGAIPLSQVRIAASTVSPVHRTAAASSATSSVMAFESRVMQVYPETSSIYFRAYGSDGTALNPVARRVGAGVWPSVVWNGSEYLLVWAIPQSRFATGEWPAIGALRIAEDGTTIGSPVILAMSSERPTQVAVAWNGSRYLIAAGRVSMLVSSDLQTKTTLPPMSSSAIASDGDRFIAVDSAGAIIVLTSDGTPVASASLGRSGEVAITYGRGRYGVIVTSADRVDAMTLTRNGEVTDVVTLLAEGGQSPSITASGDSFVAVWMTDDDLWFGQFGAGAFASRSIRPHLQLQPVLSADARGVMIGWAEGSTADALQTVLIAFTSAGALPALNDIRTVTEFAVPQRSPAIARDNRGAVIAWLENSDIFVGGLDDSGRARPSQLAVPSGGAFRDSFLRVVSSGNATLILWIEQIAGTADGRVRALRLDSESQPAGQVIEIGTTSAADTAGVAFDGESWVIVWQSSGRIVSTRLRTDGSLSVPPATPVAETGTGQHDPDVACGVSGCVAVWSESQLPIAGQRIQAARIDGGGESFTAAFAVENLAYPSIAWNGKQYLTVWLRRYNGGVTTETRAARLDDRARRFDPAGEDGFLAATNIAAAPRVKPYGPDAFVVLPAVALVAASGDSEQRIAPSLSASDGVPGGRQLFLTYSERVPLSFIKSLSPIVDEVERVFARIVDASERRRAAGRH